MLAGLSLLVLWLWQFGFCQPSQKVSCDCVGVSEIISLIINGGTLTNGAAGILSIPPYVFGRWSMSLLLSQLFWPWISCAVLLAVVLCLRPWGCEIAAESVLILLGPRWQPARYHGFIGSLQAGLLVQLFLWSFLYQHYQHLGLLLFWWFRPLDLNHRSCSSIGHSQYVAAGIQYSMIVYSLV